jgi:hypothetical protein
MASISSNPETTVVWQGWMVELRGFEPLTSAEQAHARGDSAAAAAFKG